MQKLRLPGLAILVLATLAAVWLVLRPSGGPLDVAAVPRADWSRHFAPVERDGNRVRVGYLEGGHWSDYPHHLVALIDGLRALGWLPDTALPPEAARGKTRAIWEHLARSRGPHLEFVADAYLTCEWSEESRREIRRGLLHRLTEQRDLDLVLAMGTWAGQDLATAEHDVPTIVLSTSDPVGAGILESAEDSGLDHVHAMCDPERYVRQIRAFHNIVGFRRLGVVYEDSPEGRLWGNLPDLHRVAASQGFEIVHERVPELNSTPEQAMQDCREAFRRLAPQVDAVWIGAHNGLGDEFMPEVLRPLIDGGIPTWSQLGPRAVRRGVLLSIAERDLADVGLFYAKVVAAVLRGRKPRDIVQVYEDPKAVAINLEVARRIGFDVPGGLLEVATETYDTIDMGDDDD